MSKIVNQCAAQGDVMFMRVDALPSGLRSESKNRVIVAHSETGHHHVCESPGAELFSDPNDPFTCYLQLAEQADVKHLRPYDTHETISLPAGAWKIRRQREYTPKGYRMVQD